MIFDDVNEFVVVGVVPRVFFLCIKLVSDDFLLENELFLFIELVNEVPVNDEDDGTLLRMEKDADADADKDVGVRGPTSTSDFFLFSEGEKGPSGEGALFAGIGIDFVLAEAVKFVPLGGLGNINTFLNR